MKAYVTKYALSNGIEEVNGEIYDDIYFKVKGFYFLFGEGEWFKTKEDAIKKVEEMRIKKIKYLEKQIERLKNKKF